MQNYAKPVTIYYCGRESCPPGHSFGPAIRQHYLLHIILSGQGRYQDGRHLHRLNAGQAFLIRPGDTTLYEASKSDPWEYAWVGLEGFEVPSLLKQCGFDDNNLVFTGDTDEHFFLAAEQLVDTFQSGSYNEFLLLSHLYLLFSCMLPEKSPASSDTSETSYFEGARAYIHNNYGYDIKISDIAKHVNIDRTYLFKLFKKEADTSPQQYLIDFRLKAAMNMLEDPAHSITEISFSCGFKDTPSFCRHFKKKTGKTPMEYRRSKEHAIPI